MKEFKLELSPFGDYNGTHSHVFCGDGLVRFFNIPNRTRIIWLAATKTPRKNSYHCRAQWGGVTITLSDGNIVQPSTYWGFDEIVEECNDEGLFHFQVMTEGQG